MLLDYYAVAFDVDIACAINSSSSGSGHSVGIYQQPVGDL